MSPKRIALTGNIGSGKSTVARLFTELGIPVYEADQAAKWLMQEDVDLRRSLIQRFGQAVYNEKGELDRSFLAGRVFGNPEELQALNALVHPAVARHAEAWHRKQQGPYTLHEAAITLETGQAPHFDAIIVVAAARAIRLQRVMARDGATADQVEARMARQWPDEQKEAAADYLIHNDGLQLIWPQILAIHRQILAIP